MSSYHTSVLLSEAVKFLNIQAGEFYLDGTLGGGGHTREILAQGGVVLGIDQDQEALDFVKEDQAEAINAKKLILAKGNFADLKQIAARNDIQTVSGIILDIGVSGHQFDTVERGFSFKEAKLDMRMDRELEVSAKDLLNGLSEQELELLFKKYGEEPFAHKIAKTIVKARSIYPLDSTEQLAELIRKNTPYQKIHPATRVFQALRIAVNDELYALSKGLEQAFELLRPGGRLAVISFHSLEDRIVKHYFTQIKEKATILTPKPVAPGAEEIERNSRSRSAKLRVIEKK